MWTRAELKSRAKIVLKLSYWKAFLVSLVIAFVGGNSGNFSFNWRVGNNERPSSFSQYALDEIKIAALIMVSVVVTSSRCIYAI